MVSNQDERDEMPITITLFPLETLILAQNNFFFDFSALLQRQVPCQIFWKISSGRFRQPTDDIGDVNKETGVFWSGKKKEKLPKCKDSNKLDGEIIFYSHFWIGAHDQAHWNGLKLCEQFIGKMGDGGFTFNWGKDEEKIIAYKPFKKPKGYSLKPEEKTGTQSFWKSKLWWRMLFKALRSF